MDSLEDVLTSTGLPVTFLQWQEPPALPYIVFLVEDSDSLAADNVVYSSVDNCDIELYSNWKDPASEQLVEAALTENGIYYEKTETWIQSEEMYQVVYSVQWNKELFASEEEESEEP